MYIPDISHHSADSARRNGECQAGKKKKGPKIKGWGGKSCLCFELGDNHALPAFLGGPLPPDLFLQLFIRELMSGERVPRYSRHSKRGRKHTPESRVHETY